MELVAWRVSGLDKNEWNLSSICLDTTGAPEWLANFYGKGSIPPSTHITVEIDDASEALLKEIVAH
jgi:hypothetical protein